MLILRPSPVKPRTKPLLGCAPLAPAARYPCLQRCDSETIPRINNRLEGILVPLALGYLVGLTCLMHIVPMAVLIAFRQQVLGFILQGLPWMDVILFVVIYLPLSALHYENSHHHFSSIKQSTSHSIDPILSIPQWVSLEATMKTTHPSLVLLIH